MTTVVSKPPKSIFVLNLFIYSGVFIFIFLYAWYTRVVPREALFKIFMAPSTLLAACITILFPNSLLQQFLHRLDACFLSHSFFM